MMETETKSPEELTFEEAFSELEEVVARLEAGGLTLEESLRLYERGQALGTFCNQQLNEAELTVRQLTPEGEERSFKVQ